MVRAKLQPRASKTAACSPISCYNDAACSADNHPAGRTSSHYIPMISFSASNCPLANYVRQQLDSGGQDPRTSRPAPSITPLKTFTSKCAGPGQTQANTFGRLKRPGCVAARLGQNYPTQSKHRPQTGTVPRRSSIISGTARCAELVWT